jgi:hypothetical protein
MEPATTALLRPKPLTTISVDPVCGSSVTAGAASVDGEGDVDVTVEAVVITGLVVSDVGVVDGTGDVDGDMLGDGLGLFVQLHDDETVTDFVHAPLVVHLS